jgi:cell division transport system permease protein
MQYYKKSDSFFSHFTLIFSLVAILGSLFFYQFFREVNLEYQLNLVSQSTMVVVTEKPLKKVPMPQYFQSMEPISPSQQLERVKSQFKGIDFSKVHLPYFYRLHLKGIPTPRALLYLKKKLLENPNIKRVLTFSTTQEKIYNLLMIINYISTAFMWSSLILGFMLIVKQLEVWKLRHAEQIYIMDLFGAPFWFKGATIFKIAFIDSFIALIIVAVGTFFILNSPLIETIRRQLGITLHFSWLGEIAFLALVGIFISLATTLIVIRSSSDR